MLLLSPCIILVFLSSGCATSAPARRKEPWIPPPRVDWKQIATTQVAPVENGFRILDDNGTQGRFPCAMSVSRLAPDGNDPSDPRATTLPATPHNEFLIWNNMFDNLPAISEAFPIVERNLGEYPTDPALIVSAARAFHAGLSLVYAVNQPREDQFEMLGVVHDTETGKPIAVLHALTTSRPRPQGQHASHDNVDAWEHEARALARTQFKKAAVDCLRELIARDVPQKVDAPEGWKPEGPIAPVVWPPRYFQFHP